MDVLARLAILACLAFAYAEAVGPCALFQDCKAKIPDSEEADVRAHFNELSVNRKVNAIVIHFDLVHGDENSTAWTVGRCDGALSSSDGDAWPGDGGGYFHPLRQIWMRVDSPSEMLFLPPDRAVLSLGLLADGPMRVHHMHANLSISSLCCWVALNQSEQSRITLNTALDFVQDSGILQGASQLCQLRYQAKETYDNDNPASNRDFSYTCCASNGTSDLICEEKSHFSSWYDKNTMAVIVGLLIAALISPLPFVESVAPSPQPADGIDGAAIGNIQERSFRASSSESVEVSSSSTDEEESLLHGKKMKMVGQGRYGDSSKDNLSLDGSLPFSLVPSIWRGCSRQLYGPDFTGSTGGGGAGPTRVTFWKKHELGTRSQWLFWFLLPMLLNGVRSVAYNTVLGNELHCMMSLGIATPLFLYLKDWEYSLIVVYVILVVMCLAAYPSDVSAKLRSGYVAFSTDWLSAYPTAYQLPTAAQNSVFVGAIATIFTLYKNTSVLYRIWSLPRHNVGEIVLYVCLAILCVPLDLAILLTAVVLVIFHNTPTGYLMMRLSQAASASVHLPTTKRIVLRIASISVGFSWFVGLASALFVSLLVALWVVQVVQYVVLGFLFDLDKYIVYLLQALAIAYYFYHFWQNMTNKYVRLKLLLVNEVKQIHSQEQLVKELKDHMEQIINRKTSGDTHNDSHSSTGGDHEAGGDPVEATGAGATGTSSSDSLAKTIGISNIPADLYHQLVQRHLPVRYVFFQAILQFLIVCIYIAVLDATVLLLAQFQEYSGFSRSVGLLAGTALPRIIAAMQSNTSQQLQDVSMQENIRQAISNWKGEDQLEGVVTVT